MNRALAAVLLVASTSAALAQDAASRAEALNEQGKTLFSEKQDYAGAAAKFREAATVLPDSRYFYNLCAALERLRRYEEALNACDEVFAHEHRPELAQKTGAKAAAIRQAMRAAPPPTTPPPAPGKDPPPPAPAPPPLLEVEDPGAPGYRWMLGGDLGLAVNTSVGLREYGRTGLALQLHAGVLLSQRLRLGLETYFHLTNFPERDDVVVSEPMSIISVGAAGFWHKRLWRDLHVTPLAGLQLSALSVDSREGRQTYGTLGLRLEAALEWRFPGGRHVVRAAPFALRLYLPAGQIAGEETDAAVFGFDSGGATWAFTVGYSYRFEGPPLPFSLE
jgi:hypothetical protein